MLFQSAVLESNLEVVKLLVKKGITCDDVIEHALNKYNILKYIVEHGKLQKLDYVLLCLSKTNFVDLIEFLLRFEFTAKETLLLLCLEVACKHGTLKTVQFLIEKKGVDYHHSYDCAFRKACQYGHLPVVEYLYSLGVDIHAEKDFAVRWASHNGHYNVVCFLINKGADYRAMDNWALRWCKDDKIKKHLTSLSC